jgi:hypothetical protein
VSKLSIATHFARHVLKHNTFCALVRLDRPERSDKERDWTMKIETEMPRVFIHPDGRMDRKNAARYLGCSPKTLADWAMKGIGPRYALLGGRAFYFLEDLQTWIAAAPRMVGTGGRAMRGAA